MYDIRRFVNTTGPCVPLVRRTVWGERMARRPLVGMPLQWKGIGGGRSGRRGDGAMDRRAWSNKPWLDGSAAGVEQHAGPIHDRYTIGAARVVAVGGAATTTFLPDAGCMVPE